MESFVFRSDAVAMVLPCCAGVYPVLLNRKADQAQRSLALRHELAHVLAGDVDGAFFLVEQGYMAAEERRADLFALADLVPGWWIRQVRSGRIPWRAVAVEMVEAVAEFATGWGDERLHDRGLLRLALFRKCGI